jgi:hypothetical protein
MTESHNPHAVPALEIHLIVIEWKAALKIGLSNRDKGHGPTLPTTDPASACCLRRDMTGSSLSNTFRLKI